MTTIAGSRRLLNRGAARARVRNSDERRLPLGRQIVLQLICLFIAATVLFPIVWILSMSLDPRNLARPDGLNLIPPGASLDAYARVIQQPTSNPISFIELALNSLKIAIGSSLIAVLIGVTAAYAFSRLKFRGREALMIAVLGVLMLPTVATIIPLYVFLNQFQVAFGDLSFNLRASLVGVSLAVISAQLPFAIWNLKGYLDTVPRDLEEAAAVDGATQNQIFTKIILPLAKPAMATLALLAFLTNWNDFLWPVYVLFSPEVQSLPAGLATLQTANAVRYDLLMAGAVIASVPVLILFVFLQRFIIEGVSRSGVKG
jgi:ABC-type glycerol-3-phosphate transport system permease component